MRFRKDCACDTILGTPLACIWFGLHLVLVDSIPTQGSQPERLDTHARHRRKPLWIRPSRGNRWKISELWRAAGYQLAILLLA